MRTLLVLLIASPACRIELGPPGGPAVPTEGPPTGEVWIYTSMYQSVIEELKPTLSEKFPDVDVVWFQSGSEKVAQKAEAEWATGGTKACLLMTSDPFWYGSLKAKNRLAHHHAPNVLHLDRSLVDVDGMWATSRISLMVLGVHEDRVTQTDRPTAFSDLSDPIWSDRFSMGDPLASGTMFTTLAFFQDDPGWDWVTELRDNGLIASGGNSSVLTRIEGGEREVGVLLLENLLKAQAKNTPAKPVFPSDGAIVIPGPIALTRDCRNPNAAGQVYDFLLSEEGQQIIVRGNMYSALPTVAAPTGAPALDSIQVRPWEPGFLNKVLDERGAIKERFTTMMSESTP